jgi:hypothetical protein
MDERGKRCINVWSTDLKSITIYNSASQVGFCRIVFGVPREAVEKINKYKF